MKPSPRGSGIARGTYSSAWSGKSYGEPTTASRARSSPSRRRTKVASSPVVSVAETRIAVGPSSHRRLAELLGDVDRRPGERVRLRPDDPLEPRLEAGVDLARGAERAARERVEVLGLSVQRRREVAERVGQDERRLDRHFADAAPPGGRSDRAEQAVAGPLHAIEPARGQRSLRLAARALDVVCEPPQPCRETRPPSQDAADSSSRCASSKTTASCSGSTPPPDAMCGEVERMVHDHEVGLGGAGARRLGEARGDERAAAAGAAVGPDRELAPERRRRLDLELGPVARLGLVEPRLHGVPRRAVVPAREQERLEAL